MVAETRKTRILLAEEDDLQRQLIREYLEGLNRFDILEVQGTFGILSLCESPFSALSAVLLDMEWTHVDGVELILEIRRRAPFLPILGMTGQQPKYYNEPRLRGVAHVGFITKPFRPRLLIRCVTAVLNVRGNRSPGMGLVRGLTVQSKEDSGYGQNPA